MTHVLPKRKSAHRVGMKTEQDAESTAGRPQNLPAPPEAGTEDGADSPHPSPEKTIPAHTVASDF